MDVGVGQLGQSGQLKNGAFMIGEIVFLLIASELLEDGCRAGV